MPTREVDLDIERRAAAWARHTGVSFQTKPDDLLASAEKGKDARLAASLAMTLLSPATTDAGRALKAAQIAYASDEKSIAHQRILAQARAKNGKFDKAIELQEKVVAATTGLRKESEQKLLDEYRSK